MADIKVLDLFAGLKGWSEPFAQRGHAVMTLDNDPKFDCDITIDILDWDYEDFPWVPDIICASPPCEGFSVMQIGRNWTGPYDIPPHSPKTKLAKHSLMMVEKTREIVRYFNPRWFVIENPRAKLRKLPVMQDLNRVTVSYCHYGERRAKPTDLWGVFPYTLILRPECHNQSPNHSDDCCCRDHVSAIRGSVTGTQGMNREESAKIPFPLADSFRQAAEREFFGGDSYG